MSVQAHRDVSRYANVKAAIAPELLMACDAQAVGNRFAALQAAPLLVLEWLVLGPGRKLGKAATLKPPFEQVLASKQASDIEHAVALLASDPHPDVTALLLETRKSLAKTPVPIEREPIGSARPAAPELPATFGTDQLDLALGGATQPQLKRLYRELCKRLATTEPDGTLAQYRCRAAQPGAVPDKLESRFLESRMSDEKSGTTTLPLVLTNDERERCAKALGGKCPDLPAAPLNPRGGAWGSFYRAALALAEQPGSPQPGPDTLALRGGLGWLNGVVEARKEAVRFYFVSHGITSFLVLATPTQACALTAAGIAFTQEPILADPSRF